MTQFQDMVYQTTTGTGTGNLSLSTLTNYRTFASAFPSNSISQLFAYSVRHETVGEWEVGLGYLSGGALVRHTVQLSSNANNLVNFSAGTKHILNDAPASLFETLSGISGAALTNDYNDLDNLPAIPANTSDLVNDSGFITSATANVISVAGKTGVVTLDKTDVSLANVDNTSDANKPVSIAQQAALDAKLDQLAPIVGATKTKVTYNADGLVTAGADADTNDIDPVVDRRYVTDAQLLDIADIPTAVADIAALGISVRNAAFVDMLMDDYTMTDAEASAAALVVFNVGDGTKTLYVPATASPPAVQMVFAYDVFGFTLNSIYDSSSVSITTAKTAEVLYQTDTGNHIVGDFLALTLAPSGGVLPLENGGLGLSALTKGDLLIGDTGNTVSTVTTNTSVVRKYLTQLGDGTDVTTTEFVELPAAVNQTYMFINTASSIGGGYLQAIALSQYSAGATVPLTPVNISTTPTLLYCFASNVGYPNLTVIPAGTIYVHYDIQKAAGSNNYYTYAEIYKRTAGGTETLIATSDNSAQSALNTILNVTVTALLAANVTLNATDRIVVKVYGVMASSTANVTLRIDGSTSARVELPATMVDSTNFVPYTGATADVDLGSKSITSTDVTVSSGTASRIASLDANKKVVSLDTGTYPSLTELAYVKGVTSAIQTQLNTKLIQLKVMDDTTTVTTGDGKVIFYIPSALNGMNLLSAHAYVTTVSSSGTPTVQIRNVTQAADMLTTRITIDANEYTSNTAATPPVIDTGNDDVATGDLIAVDIDVAGTGAKGLGVALTFGP